jgi:gluconolactonase
MINRRGFLTILASAACARAAGPIAEGAKPVRIGVVGASEGPVWHPRGVLYFSGGGKITQRDADGKVSVFREDAGSNGLLIDRQGRLNVCEARNTRLTRTELDGSTTVLADGYEGHHFNSPNDLTIDSKGRIYLSDPRYGSRDGMEMRDSDGKLVEGVYRIDAPGKVTRVITHEADRPNGLLVSPNDEYLYVADNNNNNVGAARKLWRFNLRADGSVDAASRKLIFDWHDGRGPDGLEMDQEGRLFVAGGLTKPNPPYETADRFKGGVYVLSPAGELLEFIAIPNDEVTNCAFGGDDWKTLFITAGGELWSIRTSSPGWVPYPKAV